MVVHGIQLKKENDTDGRRYRDNFVTTFYYSDVDVITKKQVLVAYLIWDIRKLQVKIIEAAT